MYTLPVGSGIGLHVHMFDTHVGTNPAEQISLAHWVVLIPSHASPQAIPVRNPKQNVSLTIKLFLI